MGRFLLGLAVGAGLVLLGHGVFADKINFWRYMGLIDGHSQVFSFVRKEFGAAGKDTPVVPNSGSFSHKASLLVVVEMNGVRTIRVQD